MKYGDLIQFDPINEVVAFGRLSDSDYQSSLVRSFVFSPDYERTIIPEICRQLDLTATYDTFGLQIVGNYGTGKSHLMSLFSLVAERADLLELVQSEVARKALALVAGRFRVIRFEMGCDDDLWKVVSRQIDRQLEAWDISYRLQTDETAFGYAECLHHLMAAFEQQFPEQGLMIVVDEMLSYLKARSGSDRLNRDLMVLQALGQESNHSRLRMVFGVQELVYNVAEFQFAADMLSRVNDRYRQVAISRQDVEYVVQRRLLRKTDAQRAAIREHLLPFVSLFSDLHAHLDHYVELFPVHPTFFDNFQQIRVGKSQREVLKTLSRKFEKMKDLDVPSSCPGLICYDDYWNDLNVPDMQTHPDVNRISKIMEVVHQQIDDNVTGGRASRAPLAHRIANAAAVKILQQDLNATKGATAERLTDDLMYVTPIAETRDFLIDVIKTTAQEIVKATQGQYFEQNEQNGEYHLRIKGGVNYEQKIRDYVHQMGADVKDQYFYKYLVESLPILSAQYRREFRIYRHRIEWTSHRTMLDGYIFMGNPSERSTTHPELHFYIYFMPVFNASRLQHGAEPDSVYFHFEHCSDEMRELLELYAASEALMASADTSQKPFYGQFVSQYSERLRPVFNREFQSSVEVYYQGLQQTISPQLLSAASKEQAVSRIAATLLAPYLDDSLKTYPAFPKLSSPLTPDNRGAVLRSARARIANPREPNRDGDAILDGLGLLCENRLSIDTSTYARAVVKRLREKGEGMVVNRDELLRRFSDAEDFRTLWVTHDDGLEADLFFVVLLALVACGEIEIHRPNGNTINATNLNEQVRMTDEEAYTFTHIGRPRGMNVSAVRELFLGITGIDMTSRLHDPQAYAELVTKAKALAEEIVRFQHDIREGITLQHVALLPKEEAGELSRRLDTLRNLCDKMSRYASEARMLTLPVEWTADVLRERFACLQRMREVQSLMRVADTLLPRLNYLHDARPYITDAAWLSRQQDALDRLSTLAADMTDEARVETYGHELDALKQQYIEWYTEQYKRIYLNSAQLAQKNALVQSDKTRIYTDISHLDNTNRYFTSTNGYSLWEIKMQQLKGGDTPALRQTLQRTPAMDGFDPKQYVGKRPSLDALRDEVEEAVADIDEAMRAMLLKAKTKWAILNDSDRQLVDRYAAGCDPLTSDSARRLYPLLERLQRDVQLITIRVKDLQHRFATPMEPAELRREFGAYLKELTQGYPDNAVVRVSIK